MLRLALKASVAVAAVAGLFSLMNMNAFVYMLPYFALEACAALRPLD